MLHSDLHYISIISTSAGWRVGLCCGWESQWDEDENTWRCAQDAWWITYDGWLEMIRTIRWWDGWSSGDFFARLFVEYSSNIKRWPQLRLFPSIFPIFVCFSFLPFSFLSLLQCDPFSKRSSSARLHPITYSSRAAKTRPTSPPD